MHAIKIALRFCHNDNLSKFGSVGIGQFRVLIKQFSGITMGDLYVIETPDHNRAVDGL